MAPLLTLAIFEKNDQEQDVQGSGSV